MAWERGRPGQYEGEWLRWGAPHPAAVHEPACRCAVARKARTGLP
jgi:hypothetical protein